MTPYYLVTIHDGCVQVGRTRTASGWAWNRVCNAHSGHGRARDVAA